MDLCCATLNQILIGQRNSREEKRDRETDEKYNCVIQWGEK